MKEVFADSFYYLALANPRDRAHEKAVIASELSFSHVTHPWRVGGQPGIRAMKK